MQRYLRYSELVGVGLEQGRGYLGSHFGKVRACVSVFESVQGVRRCEGFRLIPVQGNVARHTTKKKSVGCLPGGEWRMQCKWMEGKGKGGRSVMMDGVE